ncbi:MAG TPA: triose-phosphate isomerase [Gemmataceae bacterium]|nr:triose-phosphate isomerase [Gemmataceae bacterium]
MRKKFIAGNWKMFTNAASARQLATEVAKGVGPQTKARVAVCPPFPYLAIVAEALRGSPVMLGAQNCYHQKEGAFTGEVSPAMLVDVGCRYVILGHSERRHVLGETDDFINRKVKAALDAGLEVILCIGETLQERQGNQMEAVFSRQIAGSLAGITVEQMAKVVLAYEPVWAIGTGQVATAEQAQAAHRWIREHIAKLWSTAVAEALTIQYGGSAKPENVAPLLSQPDVDGGLVGGASLKADLFLGIVNTG